MADGNKNKDWRELCVEASEEPDSDKLVSLVHQILRAFEELDLETGGSKGLLSTGDDVAQS